MKGGEAIEKCTSTMPVDLSQIQMSTAEQFSLTDQAKSFVESLFANHSLKQPSVTKETVVKGSTLGHDHSIKQMSVTTTKSAVNDKQSSVTNK